MVMNDRGRWDHSSGWGRQSANFGTKSYKAWLKLPNDLYRVTEKTEPQIEEETN
jgi:hypothetical protein